MKKIIFAMVLSVIATNINAQLVVDSLGRVGVGTLTPWSGAVLSVGNYGNTSYDALIQSTVHGKQFGMYLLNHTSSPHEIFASYFNAMNDNGSAIGGRAVARGGNDSNTYQNVIGMSGIAGHSYSAVGVLGGKLTSGITVNFAGIYGSESDNTVSFSNYSGTYAGFFKGKVRVTNGIYATVLSPSASPSSSGQGGTTILSDRGESVTDKLSQVQTVQFLRYDPEQETNTTWTSLEGIDIDNLSTEELDSIVDAMGDIEPEHYLSPVQYGLDADQLKAVYPELVYEDANGNVSINYVEMVPLLVQSINELKAEIAELKGTSAKNTKALSGATAIEETGSDVDMVRMDQNKPNPFSESTVISLNIPEQTQKASIFIYDMSGKQVQNIAVNDRGETNITVYASSLSAGMYIYTLVVDGKVEVTRRMIVSE